MAARRSRRRRPPRWLAPLVLGALLGAGVGAGVILSWHGRPPQSPPTAPSGKVRHEPARPARPVVPPPGRRPGPGVPIPEENPEASQGPAIGPGAETPAGQGRPRVAIIFDDAGYSPRAAQEVMALGRPVTISVLPGLPFSTTIANEAARRGVQVILHLPLEPDNPSLPLGPGGVAVGMSDEEIQKAVAEDLATVPMAVGANNHMGSRGTADPRVMRAVIQVIKARHLFFVDSLTSPRSVAAGVARELGVPTAVRAVFLDNQDDEVYVQGQLRLLIKLAVRRGQAIAIGHVGRVTAGVLREMLPEFDEAGIQFVEVSHLVR